MTHGHTTKRIYRTLAVVALWLAVGLASAIILIFLASFLPALSVVAKGGTVTFWYFGISGYIVAFAAVFLIVVAFLLIRRSKSKVV